MDDSDEALAPWLVSEAGYPRNGDAAERARFLIRYAILAPSGHNTQPWRFQIRDDGVIDLFADRTRSLPTVDPDDRALTISCGAALETLLIAMRHLGVDGQPQLLPDPEAGDLLARVPLGEGSLRDRGDDGLFEQISRRRTNRGAFRDLDIPPALTDRWVEDARSLGVWLELIRGDDRSIVAELVAEGDRVQMADPRFRRELAAWVRPNRSRERDGVRGYGFGYGDLMSRGGPFVIRSFDLGKGQSARDRDLARHSPVLAVFGCPADDPVSWLQTGRAMQRVLLRGRAEDVWSSFLNQPVEVAPLRTRLAELVGRAGEHPQLLLRFGFGAEAKPQPRRAVEDVLVATSPA